MENKFCYNCIKFLKYPYTNVSLIGTNKKDFKKDLFEFCIDCFESFFGDSIVFSTRKDVAMSCHMCKTELIAKLPYSYFSHIYVTTNGELMMGRRRLCSECSERELFPIIHSLLIVKP